jgi:hypothetical protein
MTNVDSSILKKVSPIKIVFPILIGLAIVVFLIYKDWDSSIVKNFNFNTLVIFFLFFALLMMILRDIGYMIRLRILSNGELSWKKIFYIIMLWEFASAISPSAIGGTTVATYFIYKEGISFGRSTALVLATAFLDELYFIVIFPLIVLSVGVEQLFSAEGNFSNSYVYFAFIGYGLKVLFDLFIAYGLFVNPQTFKSILLSIFKIKFLRKWKDKGNKIGDDIIIASKELKNKSFVFWIKAYLASVIAWSARYWVVNFLLIGLFVGLNMPVMGISIYEHFEIFARQLVMWVMMLVLPSPGASGFAEAVFSDYLSVFIPIGFVGLLALAWRLISYYPYLLVGVFILPHWIKRTHSKKN